MNPMIDTHEPAVAPGRRRRRWIRSFLIAAVALAGIGVGVVLAGGNDNETPAATANRQLADITQACTTWMDGTGSSPTSANWCRDMTGWMSQQNSNGSMMGPMMWGDSDQVLTTCRAWMNANPSTDRPAEWCEHMMRGSRPHMNGDWDHWDEWMNGPMMGG